MNVLHLVPLAVGVLAFLCGLVAYLRMMRTVPPEVARQQAARLRIRQNLLCFAAPELFAGAGARYRRLYVSSLAVFAAALVGAAALGDR